MISVNQARKITKIAKENKKDWLYDLIVDSSARGINTIEVFRTMLPQDASEVSEATIQHKIKELRNLGFIVKDKFPYERHCVISWE